jgi:hypothetical protein
MLQIWPILSRLLPGLGPPLQRLLLLLLLLRAPLATSCCQGPLLLLISVLQCALLLLLQHLTQEARLWLPASPYCCCCWFACCCLGPAQQLLQRMPARAPCVQHQQRQQHVRWLPAETAQVHKRLFHDLGAVLAAVTAWSAAAAAAAVVSAEPAPFQLPNAL